MNQFDATEPPFAVGHMAQNSVPCTRRWAALFDWCVHLESCAELGVIERHSCVVDFPTCQPDAKFSRRPFLTEYMNGTGVRLGLFS